MKSTAGGNPSGKVTRAIVENLFRSQNLLSLHMKRHPEAHSVQLKFGFLCVITQSFR